MEYRTIDEWPGYEISLSGQVRHRSTGLIVRPTGGKHERIRLRDDRGGQTVKLAPLYEAAWGAEWPEPVIGGSVMTFSEWVASLPATG